MTLKIAGDQLRILGDGAGNAFTIEAPLGLMSPVTSFYIFRGVDAYSFTDVTAAHLSTVSGGPGEDDYQTENVTNLVFVD